MRAAILVLAVAACSDLPPYQPECGNGVIDPHEDCDAKDGGCFSCSLMCNFDGTSTTGCPDGLACGGDGLCHAPGGVFRTQGPVLAFGAQDLFVTDLDRDRVGDVVGIGATSLAIHKGVLYQGPVDETDLQTPFITGTPAIGHLDGNDPADTDTSLDVALPTADGFLAYSAPQGVLSPFPFALDVSGGNGNLPYALLQLDGTHQALILKAAERLVFVEVDPITRMPHTMISPICSKTTATATLSVDLVQYDASSTSTPEVVVALTLHDGTSTAGCAFAATLQGGDYVASDLLQVSPVTRLVLAATTPGTACPSAIDTDPTAVLSPFQEYRPFGSPGACGLATTPTPMTVVNANNIIATDEVAIGGVRLVPAIPGYAVDALATSLGVYAIGGNAPRLYRADRALQDVRTTDLDGDGDLDVVATPSGLDDFDLLYRYQPPQGIAQSFQLDRYDTLAHASQVVVGDFDGNQIGDIAYTEKLAYGERLMVAYGTRDRPLAPIEMATFHSVLGMIAGTLADSSDPTGTNVLDLGVLDHDADTTGNGRGLLTLLHGSPQRVMVPYLDPRPNAPLTGPSGRFISAVMGRFGGSGDIADLFGIAALGPKLSAYLARATDGAFSQAATTPDVNGLAVCSRAAADTALLCAENAHYLTWPRPSGSDVVIAVDDALPRHAVMFDPTAGSISFTPQGAITDTVVDQPLDPLAVHSLAKADLDGDGTPELIASFGAQTQARQESLAGMVVVCKVDATGQVTACTDLETAVDTSGPDGPAVCVDAAAGIVTEYQRGGAGPVPTTELMMVCHRPQLRSTQVLRVAWTGSTYTSEPVLDVPNTVERIFLGDVTGDAVADLLALDVAPGTLVPELRVYPQCTSRDTDAGCQLEAP